MTSAQTRPACHPVGREVVPSPFRRPAGDKRGRAGAPEGRRPESARRSPDGRCGGDPPGAGRGRGGAGSGPPPARRPRGDAERPLGAAARPAAPDRGSGARIGSVTRANAAMHPARKVTNPLRATSRGAGSKARRCPRSRETNQPSTARNSPIRETYVIRSCCSPFGIACSIHLGRGDRPARSGAGGAILRRVILAVPRLRRRDRSASLRSARRTAIAPRGRSPFPAASPWPACRRPWRAPRPASPSPSPGRGSPAAARPRRARRGPSPSG